MGGYCLNGVRPRRPEQFHLATHERLTQIRVSMESGLEGRNNGAQQSMSESVGDVSMESGLEGRNNRDVTHAETWDQVVSMESGLEGRNNLISMWRSPATWVSQWSPA